MHLHTLSGTPAKRYPPNSKLLCYLRQTMSPETRWLYFRAMFYRRTTPSFGVFLWCLLGFMCGLSMPLLQGCLSKSRASHCPRNMFIPEILFPCGAEVALWFSWADLSCVILLAAPIAVPTSIMPPTVRRYVGRADTVVAPVRHRLSSNPAGDPPNLDVSHHNQLQGLRFLQQEVRPCCTSKESLGSSGLTRFVRSFNMAT